MNELFIKLLELSIKASFLVVAVFALRLILKKAPKWTICAMWALCGIRLMLPFSLESAFSLLPQKQPVSQYVTTGAAPAVPAAEIHTVDPTHIAAIVWLCGFVLMLIYAAVSSLRVRLRVRESLRIEDGIYICDRIDTPFIFGIFRPKIYLDSSLSESDVKYVLSHEKAHLERFDNLWKPLGFALLSVYWFNPVIWVAYILFCRDIELACDEKVIRNKAPAYKKRYSTALLNCSVSRRTVSVFPLSFGETGVKMRVKRVLNYKKPTLLIVTLALILSIMAGLFFLTDPKQEKMLLPPVEVEDEAVENVKADPVINIEPDVPCEETENAEDSASWEDTAEPVTEPRPEPEIENVTAVPETAAETRAAAPSVVEEIQSTETEPVHNPSKTIRDNVIEMIEPDTPVAVVTESVPYVEETRTAVSSDEELYMKHNNN